MILFHRLKTVTERKMINDNEKKKIAFHIIVVIKYINNLKILLL